MSRTCKKDVQRRCWCSACNKQSHRDWRKENIERIRAQRRERSKLPEVREKNRMRRLRWRLENPERARRINKEYRKRNYAKFAPLLRERAQMLRELPSEIMLIIVRERMRKEEST